MKLLEALKAEEVGRKLDGLPALIPSAKLGSYVASASIDLFGKINYENISFVEGWIKTNPPIEIINSSEWEPR